MKGCEVQRDGIIVPGAGTNSNMHSSRLSTSLFLASNCFIIEPTKQLYTLFLANVISTELYMDPCIYMLISQVLVTERGLETTSKSSK